MSAKSNRRRTEYRQNNYRQYNLIVEQGSLLEALLERYREVHRGDRKHTLSRLIRECLCDSFGIADGRPYVEYRISPGQDERLPGDDVDALLTSFERRSENPTIAR